MSKICKLFISLSLVSFLDIFISTVLLINGNQWSLFISSFYDYSFTDSFIDLWALGYLRSSVVFGGLLGVLCNQRTGPFRCKASFWIVKTFSFLNVYLAFAKLLAFSDGRNFVAGVKLYWFWGLFAWTFLGSLLCVISWHLLCGMQNYTIRKMCFSSADDATENQSLLQENSYKNYTDDLNPSHSINGSQSNNNISKNEESNNKKNKGYNELLNKVTVFTLLSYTRPDWLWIVAGTFFLLCASVSQVFLPFYIGKVISVGLNTSLGLSSSDFSGIVVSRDVSNFVKNILIMAGISLLASVCAGIRGGCFMVTIQKLNIRVRNALFTSLTSQEIGFFDNMKTGDITSRLTSDTTTMSDSIGLNCNIFLRNTVKAVGLCVFMFALSWRMSILTLMGLPLVFVVSRFYGNYYKKWQKQVQDGFAIANEVAEEVCSSMKTVRSFANEDGERKRYRDKLNDVYTIQFKQALSYSGYVWSTQGIQLMLTVGTLWFGGHLLLENNLSSQNFISFILYQEELGNCINEFGEVYTGLMQALGAAEKVFELIKREPVIKTDEGHEKPMELNGQISFRNVTFCYPRRPNQKVLKNVSFDVNPGEVVALVGPSGGGKSSCVKLLQRFYDPTSGSVLLDGIPVRSYDHKYLHAKVSMVGQEPVLYARSVQDNILYGLDNQKFTEAMFLEAAFNANCHDFIMELPEKYETETGEKGTQLSGGQKQRIAIARAMVRNPCVLLLDEATSALDTESEYLVQQALERSKSRRTVLLIAHRLSTVERADRIVVIVKGQVKEIGNHRELMEKQGVYYNLVRRQLHVSEEMSEDFDDFEVKRKRISPPNDVDFPLMSNHVPIKMSTSASSDSSSTSQMKI